MDLEKIFDLLEEDPEAAGEMLVGLIQAYKPCVYSIGNELLEIYKDYVNKDELYALSALHAKKAFDAYENAGFTKAQAMQLVLATTGSASNILKNASSNVKINK